VKTWERWTFSVLCAVIAATGFAFLVMKYLMVNDDPFAVVNHPWQPAMLHLHVLASPPLILMFGILLNGHILRQLRVRKVANRGSGIASLVTFALMVASGYLLQVVSAEMALTALVVVHVASGTVFVLTYAAHLVISVRLSRVWTPIREIA
jgi:hypothetical protein